MTSRFAARPQGGNLDDVIAGMTGVNAARSADVCEWGCRALNDFARAGDQNAQVLFEKGGVEALKYVVEKHPKHVKLQIGVCNTLGSLAPCDAARVSARENGLLAHVVTILDVLQQEETVCIAACQAISALAVDEESKSHFGESLAPQLLAGALLAHPDLASVQHAALLAIRAVAHRHEANTAILLDQGLPPALLHALSAHSTAGAVVQAAGETIEALFISVESRLQLHALDIEPLLVAAMSQFTSTPTVLQGVFRATARLAQHSTPRGVLMSFGVMGTIVAAMQTHRTHLDLQLYACWALLELASDDDSSSTGPPEVEVVDAVLGALQRHTRNATVVQYACIALENLAARSDESRVHVAQRDGCKLVMTGLQKHVASEPVARAALRTLAVLAANDAKMHEHLTQIGGVPLTVELMTRHASSAAIVANGCRCLANLALHARVRGVMDKEAVVSAVLGAWQAHPTAFDVGVFAACALEHLAEEAIRRVKFSEEASKLAIDAMAAHPRDEDLQLACIRLLLRLAQTANDRIGSTPHFIAAITAAMQACPDTPDLVACAVTVLAILSENVDNRASIRQKNGIGLTLAAMTGFPESEEIAECGCSVLGNLAFKTGKERKPCAPIAPAEPAAAVSSLRTHPLAAGVATRAAAALRNICCHDLGREYAVRSGAIAELLATCNRFPTDENVLFPACAALNNIAKDKDLRQLISLTGLRALVASIRTTLPPTAMAARAAEELLLRRGMGGAP